MTYCTHDWVEELFDDSEPRELLGDNDICVAILDSDACLRVEELHRQAQAMGTPLKGLLRDLGGFDDEQIAWIMGNLGIVLNRARTRIETFDDAFNFPVTYFLTPVEWQVVQDLYTYARSLGPLTAPPMWDLLELAGFDQDRIVWVIQNSQKILSTRIYSHPVAGASLTPVEENVIKGLVQRVEAELAYMYSDTEQDEYKLPCFKPGYNSSLYSIYFLTNILSYLHQVGFSIAEAKAICDARGFSVRGFK